VSKLPSIDVSRNVPLICKLGGRKNMEMSQRQECSEPVRGEFKVKIWRALLAIVAGTLAATLGAYAPGAEESTALPPAPF
jgi:hypothetical protein